MPDLASSKLRVTHSLRRQWHATKSIEIYLHEPCSQVRHAGSRMVFFDSHTCMCHVPECAMASVCSGLPCITSTAPAPAPGTFCPMKTHAHCAFSNSSLTFAVVVSTVFFRFPPLAFLGSSRVNGGDPPHGKQAKKRSIALGQCCTTHDAYQRPPAATPFSVVLPRLVRPFSVLRAETSADRSF